VFRKNFQNAILVNWYKDFWGVKFLTFLYLGINFYILGNSTVSFAPVVK
jgi:hypothetical protein